MEHGIHLLEMLRRVLPLSQFQLSRTQRVYVTDGVGYSSCNLITAFDNSAGYYITKILKTMELVLPVIRIKVNFFSKQYSLLK